MISLRPYQRDAVAAVERHYDGGGRRPGVSLPTGAGKTRIMTALTERHAGTRDGAVGWLLHRDQLVEQSVATLRALLPPTISVGVVKGPRNEVGADVVVASVHSLRRAERRAALPRFRLVVADEAHVTAAPTYAEVFAHARAQNPDARFAGFTATWTRSDSRGLGDFWEEVVYHKTIQWAVREGVLVRPRGIRIGVPPDLSEVRVSRATGDYREEDLERVVMLESVRDAVVDGVLRHGGDRPGVLFAPTVESMRYFAQALEEAGVSTAEVVYSTSASARRAAHADHAAGRVRLLTTCTALAEGWDAPHCSLGVLCRPTRHEGLFVQMAGRLLRPWPGKVDALLLDAVGATRDVRLRNAVALKRTPEPGESDELPDGLEELDEEWSDPDEEVGVERVARVVERDVEVSLFAGTQVQWLTSHVGVPFVPCGDSIVFLVEGRSGWMVGHADDRLGADGRPRGRWVAEGLSQDDALALASDHAECEGEHLSRRSAGWRSGRPSEKQVQAASRMGIVTTGMTRGQVSDAMSRTFASRVLAPFAAWSEQQRRAS